MIGVESMSNGKGDTPRPLSVDIKTYKNNWERIFNSKDDTCEYSGLPSTQSYNDTTNGTTDGNN